MNLIIVNGLGILAYQIILAVQITQLPSVIMQKLDLVQNALLIYLPNVFKEYVQIITMVQIEYLIINLIVIIG